MYYALPEGVHASPARGVILLVRTDVVSQNDIASMICEFLKPCSLNESTGDQGFVQVRTRCDRMVADRTDRMCSAYAKDIFPTGFDQFQFQ